ncbi:MAG: ethanolamine ammonia-lyase subunit EutB [Planctomyces sp.]
MISRRHFLQCGSTIAATVVLAPNGLRPASAATASESVTAGSHVIRDVVPGESVIQYVQRKAAGWDQNLYRQVIGAANEFKEGDAIIGVAAADEQSRTLARTLLSETSLREIDKHSFFEDELLKLLRKSIRSEQADSCSQWKLKDLKTFLLERSEAEIKAVRDGLSSDVIGCVVRLMNNEELIQVGAKIFNPLPGSHVGSRGYMGARVQPNSPTDHVDDIRWQVFDAFSYAVGDALLGTNPVSSEPASVAAIEQTLRDILVTFGIDHIMPHCVLSHIDVQAEVERQQPGSTELWFQSIAGNDAANQTFDLSVEKMVNYSKSRTGRFGLYFETGQGADFTNGHGHGTDMVIHESRKYGFARALTQVVAESQRETGTKNLPWVHLNDVAGFIGPEVFRTREQLVRCCLEDIVMGKLHGLTIGLDVCTTLHMDVSLDDLGWCIDQIMPACPAYLMALPTRIDPMLGYLTTGYQDHVHIRERFGHRVDDRMWSFFQKIGVIDSQGQPTRHFGDPLHVYVQFCRTRGDQRTDEEIRQEGQLRMSEVRSRGVFLAEGYGESPSKLKPELNAQIHHIYEDARECIWREMTPAFVQSIPGAVALKTRSGNREDYILHPVSGEHLSDESIAVLDRLRKAHSGRYDTQIVVSDGLNPLAVMDEGQLSGFLLPLREELKKAGFVAASDTLVVESGRVRAGYRIGEQLFSNLPGRRTILHVVGERPGSGHHTLSIYMTTADGSLWMTPNAVDHNITRVVSGIALTAFNPSDAAVEAVRILKQMA